MGVARGGCSDSAIVDGVVEAPRPLDVSFLLNNRHVALILRTTENARSGSDPRAECMPRLGRCSGPVCSQSTARRRTLRGGDRQAIGNRLSARPAMPAHLLSASALREPFLVPPGLVSIGAPHDAALLAQGAPSHERPRRVPDPSRTTGATCTSGIKDATQIGAAKPRSAQLHRAAYAL